MSSKIAALPDIYGLQEHGRRSLTTHRGRQASVSKSWSNASKIQTCLAHFSSETRKNYWICIFKISSQRVRNGVALKC